MNRLFRISRRAQGLADLLPMPWRLPLRYHVQNAIGGLEPEFSLLPQLVPRDMVALDIGANMGVYSYALAGLASHVHAFEPQAACCEVISSWALGRNVTVHNAGVGPTSGELVLHVPVVDGRKVGTRASFTPVAGDHEDIRVPVISIDALAIEPVGFIKIDVEGFEHDVLVGADETLRRWQPVLLIELDRERQTRESFERTLEFLASRGYAPSVLEQDRLIDCADGTWSIAAKHYNFIFTKTGVGSPASSLASGPRR